MIKPFFILFITKSSLLQNMLKKKKYILCKMWFILYEITSFHYFPNTPFACLLLLYG